MELIVRDVPEEPFSKVLKDIRVKLPFLEELPNLKVYAISGDKEPDLPLADLPVDVGKSFRRLLSSSDSSFFYGDENQNLVVVKVTDENKFVLENTLALKGLLAHELVHALQKNRGLDVDIKRCYSIVVDEMSKRVEELDYDEDVVWGVIDQIGLTAILVLKDLYVIDELLRKDLGGAMLEYYSELFGLGRTCPLPEFHKIREGERLSEEELGVVVDTLNFELQLLPTWLPFEKRGGEKARDLKEHIEECYEADLGWIAKHFHDIVVLYLTEFANTCKFHRDYYRLIFNRVYSILAGEDLFYSHLKEALDILKGRERDSEEEFIYSNILKALYLHFRDRSDGASVERGDELEETLRKVLSEEHFEEFLSSGVDKVDLLKVPILWSVKRARREFAESPRSDFIDVAYACVEAASDESKNLLFEHAGAELTKLDVFSPYELVGDLLKLEFMFEEEIFGRAPELEVVDSLMSEFKKRAILPDNDSVPVAKEIINLTFRSDTEDPEHLALFYVNLIKLTPENSDLLEATLTALGYELDFIHAVNKQIIRLNRQAGS